MHISKFRVSQFFPAYYYYSRVQIRRNRQIINKFPPKYISLKFPWKSMHCVILELLYIFDFTFLHLLIYAITYANALQHALHFNDPRKMCERRGRINAKN